MDNLLKVSRLDDLVLAELVDLISVKTEPFGQNLICVLSEQRRRLEFGRAPAEANWPARHFEWASDGVLHRLHDPAPLEIRLLSQLHGIEDCPSRHAGAAEHAHRLALVVLACPGGDHR